MVDTSGKRWPIIQDILRKEGIAKQHINSFNEFLESGLQSIIKEVSQIEIENAEYPYKVQLGKIKLQKPRMILDGSRFYKQVWQDHCKQRGCWLSCIFPKCQSLIHGH